MASEGSEEIVKLIQKVDQAGQSHILHYLGELDREKKETLLEEIKSVDFGLVSELYKTHHVEGVKQAEEIIIEPYPNILDISTLSKQHLKNLHKDGLKLIAEGKVAVLMFAGGQATRLGVSYPKGMYDIGLLSHKSLFQIYSERLISLQTLASESLSSPAPPIPWLIMTNQESLLLIQSYFRSNAYFGLDQSQLFFFPQEMLPAIDFDGKILLSQKNKLSLSPNGNGGVYESLEKSGGLLWLENKRIKFLHICGVDNALLKICDPKFIGYAEDQDVDVVSKVVAKKSYNEACGVLAMKNSKLCVVEYSELSEEMAKSVDEEGKLRYFGGNILNHIMKVSFIRRIVSNHLSELRSKYHVARKKVPHIENGQVVTPNVPNALKFELFYFDVLELAESSAALCCDRDSEFSPVKNASGPDSPESARTLINNLHLKWVEKAGGILPQGIPDGIVCEISPLVSYDGENLKFLENKKISLPFYLYY
ncbi:unnamed protein product [Blepharisma stoltei]|uniref:UDP-N-acetylglucosamine diphosphorylase n=1 Tax=Blepharisma stoltei TaxID=1481888 RepID=A0AAU9JRD1_9CILI|nr:unnamed protein product [Blepharisma stoltei]